MPLAPILDAAFLKPFTLPNAEVLARILADLYAETRRASQPLSYAVALDILIKHTLTPGEDDPLPRARAILAELEADGWLRVDVQPDYTRAVALTRPAFQLLQYAQASSVSVSELLVTIHDLLKAALLDIGNEARLAAAARLTDQLVDTLKALQHTTTEIELLPDTSRLRAAVLDSAAKLEARGYAPARSIRLQFETLDGLFEDIAARRALRETAGRDTQPSAVAGHLRVILGHLATADRKLLTKQLDSLINLYHSVSSTPQSSPTPEAERKGPISNLQSQTAFEPVDWPIPEITEADVAVARHRLQQQLNRPVSPNRLQRLATQLIEGKPLVRAADLVTEGRVDLPLLIQLRLHAEDALGYSIEEQQWVETNGLVFRDFVIKNPNYVPPFTEADLSAVLSGTVSENVAPTEPDTSPADGEQSEAL